VSLLKEFFKMKNGMLVAKEPTRLVSRVNSVKFFHSNFLKAFQSLFCLLIILPHHLLGTLRLVILFHELNLLLHGPCYEGVHDIMAAVLGHLFDVASANHTYQPQQHLCHDIEHYHMADCTNENDLHWYRYDVSSHNHVVYHKCDNVSP